MKSWKLVWAYFKNLEASSNVENLKYQYYDMVVDQSTYLLISELPFVMAHRLVIILLACALFFSNAFASESILEPQPTVHVPITLSHNTTECVCDNPDFCEGNTPDTRKAWCSRDIYTDYETDYPDTGVTRYYWFVVGDYYHRPDGHERATMAVNGSIPGPTIFANWGDWVVVNVFNNINVTDRYPGNASVTIHWHGINQFGTVLNDGVSSITQCPLIPQHNMTYRWRATQYGTAWYHAHISLLAWDGVFGGIIINGPASADYEEDLGVLMISDWTHLTPEEAYDTIQLFGPQTLSTGLLNGSNVWNPQQDAYACPSWNNFQKNMTGTCHLKRDETEIMGSRFNLTVEAGLTYRLRLVNAAVDNSFEFLIEGHDLTVIAADLVPINNYTTHSVKIFAGKNFISVLEYSQ